MVLGHAALGSLCDRFLFPRAGLVFCVVAAFGPDWIDKPLKLLFGLPGHGIAHSLLGATLLLWLFARLCHRWSLPASWPWLAVFFWALHLLCDQVRLPVLLWPLAGPFPVNDASTAALAQRFYAARPLSALAWCDLLVTAVALAARLVPWAAGKPWRGPALAGVITLGKERRFIDTKASPDL